MSHYIAERSRSRSYRLNNSTYTTLPIEESDGTQSLVPQSLYTKFKYWYWQHEGSLTQMVLSSSLEQTIWTYNADSRGSRGFKHLLKRQKAGVWKFRLESMSQGWFSNWQLSEARQSRCVLGGAVKQSKKSLRQVSKMQHQNTRFRIKQQAGNQRYHKVNEETRRRVVSRCGWLWRGPELGQPYPIKAPTHGRRTHTHRKGVEEEKGKHKAQTNLPNTNRWH